MSRPLVYIDRSDIHAGKVPQLRDAVTRLVSFVEEREPQLAEYAFYIDEDALAMTLVAIHPDSASLELHLQIGDAEFRRVGEFITLRSIEIFGEASEAARALLREKARMLGGATLTIRAPAAGFSRVPAI